MSSLAGELLCCPLCQGEWQKLDTWGKFWVNYACNKDEICQMMYFKPSENNDNINFFLRKLLANGTTIWWSTNMPCKLAIIGMEIKFLDYVLPFQLDEERIKLFTIMS